MSDVRVAGIGLTKFGEFPDRTGRDLFGEASNDAIEDADVPRDDIEEVLYGNFMGELSEHQGHQGPLMAEAAGVRGSATRCEAACASGSVPVRTAVKQIRTGESDVVLVGGAERMTNLGTAGATEGLAMAADELWEVRAGITFPGAYALMARAYFERYGGGQEDLAHIAVKNHENALANENAHHRQAIATEDVLEAPQISTPLGLYDACPISDGAAALVLTSESYAEAHDLEAPVAITGTGQGGDRLALHDREFLERTPATRQAGQEAYADAGVTAGDVDLAEVHDCFTIAEVLAIEGLDIEPLGEGVSAARDGRTAADGETPVNLSGGLKAKGHPVGATGAAQIAEATSLLRGDHPNSEHLEDATTALTHNAGGTVATAIVHVLEVVA
ncbi:thiolase C-terminal domain-containing protein [Natrialbaceae archaeon AArc-T1-2]|uniref:thiolase C-terminal domain-containing protein n=1 Tax=Natrialbaceae archaeon AArc-T1-2 TaxID=3053904 RepID=UPI00255B0B02|nr:beta-ketoacyl synthase N-terminal-like domain-containing protein [Natrialbaceae archaeon AArc-T1-2]WIV68183.1 beta-ketoacyl synthase N-terminal-like domain-containing protein [Natrialbaceae archaeon AArc-T1-2]